MSFDNLRTDAPATLITDIVQDKPQAGTLCDMLVLSTDDRDKALRENATILMVDDEAINMQILHLHLEESGYRHFITISDSTAAMKLIRQNGPDVILLDLDMPVVTGFDILTEMRGDEALAHIPVIVLTSSDDSATRLRALQLGAMDFLAKPVDSSELAVRLRNTLAAKAYQDHLTYYDNLTGLPNRSKFSERLDQSIRSLPYDDECGALLHIDLDRFKRINDTLGHTLGDTLLKHVAQRLEQYVRTNDMVGRFTNEMDSNRVSVSRLGGDEFTLLIPRLTTEGNATRIASRILRAMEEPFNIDGHDLVVTPSIGIAIFPTDGRDIDTLLKHADVAMYHAKQRGRNCYEFYSREMNARSHELLSLESELRNALDNDEFLLNYQPKVDVATGRVVGAEALIRWEHPRLGMVSPMDFIPLAEETGLIVPIGEWVMRTACKQTRAWHQAGLDGLQMAINVSVRQLHAPALVESIHGALVDSGLHARYITIEMTENMIMENANANIKTLNEMKALGVRLSVDDFGTGYSSLSYLHRFPLDELKVDRSFVNVIKSETDIAPIASAVIAMAHSLDLSIVAEGVETGTQLEFLRRSGCAVYQGFLFSKPVKAEDFLALALGGKESVTNAPP